MAELYRATPYIVRVGEYGTPPQLSRVYEVYNEMTGIVEDRQQVLPNAIRAAKIYAAALQEAVATPLPLWPEDSSDEEE